MKVLIADDHGIVRQGLMSLLSEEEDIDLVGQAEDGKSAVHMVAELAPDVIVMDITMPGMDGVEATRLICERYPATRVVALSMHDEPYIVREILRAGAVGYVLKSYLGDEAVKAIRAAVKGEHYLSPEITDVVVESMRSKNGLMEACDPSELSERELAVLKLTAEGKAVKEIARKLHISPKTAHSNRHDLMEKLDVSSVAELTRYAIRHGVIRP